MPDKRIDYQVRIRALIVLTGILSLPAYASEVESIQVQFANSCAPSIKNDFNNAVTMLHSFEYLESARIFTEIVDRDPSCAMARWGAAMSIWHPLWAPPNKADLEKGAAILSDAATLDATPREKSYLDAINSFYSSTDVNTHLDRARDYESLMSAIYASNLNDPEAAMFYALSILATADPRDKTYAHQFRSAGLLNWVKTSQPTHPGVLHYLIHSYDYPGLAHLALDSALIYADAAPDSAHAQHMPSHIFTRLGLWDRSLSSNHDSTASAADYTVRAHLSGHYDEGLHSIDYLMYAMLQTARDDDARELLGTLSDIKKTNTENFKVAYTYASSPARNVLERRAWEEASELTLMRPDLEWSEFGWARSINHYARGLGSARSGQPDKATREIAAIVSVQKALAEATLPYWREQVQVHVDVIQSWISLAEGEESAALQLASSAADREDAVDKHPVTPGEVLPARELYADMLFETGDYASALEQYRIVLHRSPNRLNALLGAARSAERTGDIELMREYYSVVRQQTRHGNRRRAGVSDAWAASL